MKAIEFLAKLKKEIAKAEDLRKVYRKMEFLLKGDPKELEIIHNQSRYEELQRKIRLGTLDFQTQSIEINRIKESLLSLISLLEEELKENEKLRSEIDAGIAAYYDQDESCPSFWEWVKSNKGIKRMVAFFCILYVVSLLLYLVFQNNLTGEKCDGTGNQLDFGWNLPMLVHWLFIITVCFWLFKFKRFSVIEGDLSYTHEATNQTAAKSDQSDADENEKKEAKVVSVESQIRDRLRLTKLADYEDWSESEKEKLWHSYKKGVNKTLEQFSSAWFFMWALWAIFYGVLLSGVKSDWAPDFLNYLGTATFLFMYLTLAITTTGRIIFSLLIKILLIIVLVTALQEFLEPRLGDNPTQVQFWFKLVVGIVACSIFSTVFGRLIDSKFVNTPIVISICLYAYAAIQPLYAFWGFTEMDLWTGKCVEKVFNGRSESTNISINYSLMLFSLTFAFYLKLILFLVISWIIRSGRLLYFVTQEGSLNYKQDDEIKQFMKHVPVETSRII
ncbi:MAG: hypothetical protein SFV22_14495 [Saprospiraceae bacterium]|nr:hypothetical protein [Saprospiraceae bacterium]